MSASNPGPVRRFFRGAWRVIDVSRRVVLNLLFLLILIAVIVAFASSGPLPLAERPRSSCASTARSASRRAGNLRSTALDQVRGEAVAEGAAARHPQCARRRRRGSEDLEPRRRPRRACGRPASRRCARSPPRSTASRRAARRSSPGARATTSASTTSPRMPTRSTCIRSAWSTSPASAACATTTRTRSTSSASPSTCVRVGTFKSAVEPYIANGRRRAALEADKRALRRPLEDVHRRGREGEEAAAPDRSCAGIDEAPQRLAAAGGDAAKLALAEKLVDGAEDPRRAARADDRARRQGRRATRPSARSRSTTTSAHVRASASPATRSASSSPRARSSTARRRRARSAACRPRT